MDLGRQAQTDKARHEIEQRVLGCMITGRDYAVRALDILGVNVGDADSVRYAGPYFRAKAHQDVFKVLCGMVRLGRFPLDGTDKDNLQAVADHLALVGVGGEMGGNSYFVELYDSVSCGEIVDHWSSRLLEYHRRDEYQRLSTEALEEIADKPVQQHIDTQVRKLLEIQGADRIRAFETFYETCDAGWNTYHDEADWMREHPGELPGALTVTSGLDDKTGGFRPGTLTILSADTARGKTSFALQCALRNLIARKRVLFFSLEMTSMATWERLAANHYSIPLENIVRRRLPEESQGLVADLGNRGWSLMLVAGQRLSPTQMMARCHRAMYDGPVDLVVVDYLQYALPEATKDASRERQVASIADSLKAMSQQFNTPVLALSQVNEQEQARESRAIIHVADTELLLKLPKEPWASPDEYKNHVQIVIRKQRQMPTGMLDLWWEGRYVRFHDTEIRFKTVS